MCATPTSPESQPEPGRLEQFIRSPQGQIFLRIVTTVITIIVDHYFKW